MGAWANEEIPRSSLRQLGSSAAGVNKNDASDVARFGAAGSGRPLQTSDEAAAEWVGCYKGVDRGAQNIHSLKDE